MSYLFPGRVDGGEEYIRLYWTAMAAAICVSCLGASEAFPLRREL